MWLFSLQEQSGDGKRVSSHLHRGKSRHEAVEMVSNYHLVHNKENPAYIDTVGSMNNNMSGGHENHQNHLI